MLLTAQKQSVSSHIVDETIWVGRVEIPPVERLGMRAVITSDGLTHKQFKVHHFSQRAFDRMVVRLERMPGLFRGLAADPAAPALALDELEAGLAEERCR